MTAAPRPVALAAALMIPAAFAPGVARAVEPTKGKDPLIRTWTYARGVSLDLTSFGGLPVVLVLGPGETVKHHTSQYVSQNKERAEAVGGWYMPNNAVAPARPRDQTAADDAEEEAETKSASAGAGGRPPAPSLIADQVVLQPTRLDIPPVTLSVVTVGTDGELRPYLLVLRVSKQDIFDPKSGQPVGYAQAIVQHPAKPDPAALAAAGARREAARDRRDALYAQMRLAATGGAMGQGGAASAPGIAGPESFDMGDGRKSPGACQVLRPTDIADTGRQTTLTFDPRQPRMQVYGFTAVTGEPTRVQAVPENRPDGWFQYVLPGTYQRIALSSEGRVCVLHNKAYNRAPVPNTTGTSSQDVALVPR